METRRINKGQIKKDLLKLGIGRSSVIVLHSSLSSIGYVEGGADTVIDAFLEILGNEGTLMTPAFTCSVVNLKGSRPFNPYESPPRSMGVIAERLWLRKGALRSLHPTHSVVAIGKEAGYLTCNHEKVSPLGKNSPFHKLGKKGGYILLLGVSQTSNSIIHTAESLAEVPYLDIPFKNWGREALILEEDGTERRIVLNDFPGCSRGFSKAESVLQKKGIIIYGRIGKAKTQFIKAEDLLKALFPILKENSGFLLCDNSDCETCQRRKKRIREITA